MQSQKKTKKQNKQKVMQKNWNYAKIPSIVSGQTSSTAQSITRHQKLEST